MFTLALLEKAQTLSSPLNSLGFRDRSTNLPSSTSETKKEQGCNDETLYGKIVATVRPAELTDLVPNRLMLRLT